MNEDWEDIDDARNQGYIAYDREESRENNPYNWRTEHDLANAWDLGWLDARADNTDSWW